MGILWPNLMLFDGEQAMEVMDADSSMDTGIQPSPPTRWRFRVHVDVQLEDAAQLDSLRGLLRQPTQNEQEIRTLLTEAAKPDAKDFVAAIPFRPHGGRNHLRPQHELFVDTGRESDVTYWYRMNAEVVIRDSTVAQLLSVAMSNKDTSVVKTELRKLVQRSDSALLNMIDAITMPS